MEFPEEKILGLLEQKYGVLCPCSGNMGNGLPIIMSFLDFGKRSASSAPFPINSAEDRNRVRADLGRWI